MKNSLITVIFISAFVAVLSGCADHYRQCKDKCDVVDNPKKQFYDTRFYLIVDKEKNKEKEEYEEGDDDREVEEIALDVENINKLKEDPDLLNPIIGAIVGEEEPLSEEKNREKLRKLIQRIDQGSSFEGFLPENLKGIAGIQATWALDYLLCSDSISNLDVVGKIDKWIYNKGRNSGYIYWHAKRTDCNGVERKYEFHIAVDEAYEEHENKSKEKYGLKFPELEMQIPKEERERIEKQKRHFDYKLHAEGSRVIVLSAFIDGNLVDASNPIYTSTEDSCIDVLFRGKPPATQLPIQEWYCMGRCGHPPLINTGGD